MAAQRGLLLPHDSDCSLYRMTSNPYQPPQFQKEPAATPRPRAMAGAIALALFFGGVVFVGSCFGGGLLTIGIAYDSPYADLVFYLLNAGSALAAIVTAIRVYRRRIAGVEDVDTDTAEAEKADR